MHQVRIILTVSTLLFASQAKATDISSTEIISRTAEASLACMQWTPVGLCFWLQCTWFSCEVESSLKIGHYNPDLVVSSYNELGENPWREIRSVLGSVQRQAAQGILGRLGGVAANSAGNRTEGRANREHKNLIFRETDVIGHPSVTLPLPGNVACASSVNAFVPYFLSGLDALSWRHAMPEGLYPASVVPGLREVGRWPLQTWGGVYPRTGWSIQSEEPKAAALTAQRAGDIITRRAQPHVYLPLPDSAPANQRVWPPEPLVEGDSTTGYWQMISPVTDSDCAVFGANDLYSDSGWGGDRVDEHGDYVWNLWRPYQCCERQGQFFLFDINWVDYPR
jgi:integrating conjugative element protein (TIGR03756 family)